jgi:predicted dienelactone hydrolase
VVAEGEHPVVVFSHGYTATFTDYTFLFEDLASRGYVVASIDHTREATAVEFPDGRFVASAVGSHLGGPLRAERADLDFALALRLGDVKFVGDELARLNGESGGAFAGKLDLSKMALAGHSLGGWTAIESVSSASVFKVGVAIDASIPTGAAISTEKPMLLLGMGRELWSDDEQAVWSGLHGPRFALNLPGAEHKAPSDAVWLARYAINTGSLSPKQTIAMVREYVAAFLDSNLRGQDASPLLKGPVQRYRDVVVTTQKESLRSKN